MIVHTDERKISEIKKRVNRITDERISIVPNINIEELVENTQTRIFVNQLIALTTNIAERKNSELTIVLYKSGKRLSKAKEQRLNNIIEQMTHQLEFTKVALLICMKSETPIENSDYNLMSKSSKLIFLHSDNSRKA